MPTQANPTARPSDGQAQPLTAAWYAKATSAGQSMIADEITGRTVAVAYDEQDGPLLAAAPALLEWLEWSLDAMDKTKMPLNSKPFRQAARAALALAKGEAR